MFAWLETWLSSNPPKFPDRSWRYYNNEIRSVKKEKNGYRGVRIRISFSFLTWGWRAPRWLVGSRTRRSRSTCTVTDHGGRGDYHLVSFMGASWRRDHSETLQHFGRTSHLPSLLFLPHSFESLQHDHIWVDRCRIKKIPWWFRRPPDSYVPIPLPWTMIVSHSDWSLQLSWNLVP